jgi:hypothetical protein
MGAAGQLTSSAYGPADNGRRDRALANASGPVVQGFLK